ncbi:MULTISPECIES: hypothetical protein [unclassified Nonomuraea]
MGAGRHRTTVSAGLLALALAALPIGAGSAQAQARDCERGGGLLSGVTSGVCDLVDGVTDVVDGVTGNSLSPVTETVDRTTDTVLAPVGEVAPTAKPAPTSTRSPGTPREEPGGQPTGRGDDLVSSTLEEVCLPVLACEGEGVLSPVERPATEPPASAEPAASPSPSPSATPARRRKDAVTPPTEATVPPMSRPQLRTTREVVPPEPAPVDPDDPRVELLWPGPFSEKLSDRIGGQVVRPSEPESDVLGTTLTAVLLASAVLAARVMQSRRGREERPESIPFEPMRVGGGRHRLA